MAKNSRRVGSIARSIDDADALCHLSLAQRQWGLARSELARGLGGDDDFRGTEMLMFPTAWRGIHMSRGPESLLFHPKEARFCPRILGLHPGLDGEAATMIPTVLDVETSRRIRRSQ